mgnify:CR=1 FL=1
MKKILLTSAILALSLTGAANASTVYGEISTSTEIDYYSFSVASAGTFTFDMLAKEVNTADFFGNGIGNDNLDTEIAVISSDYSTLFGSNDDSSTSFNGSIHNFDSYLSLALTAGDYLFAVSGFSTQDSEFLTGETSGHGTGLYRFDTNANIDGVSAVPVPAAVWLMGSGLLGLMGFSRKNKKLAA